MVIRSGIGRTGVALAALIAIAMCILSLIFKPVEFQHIQYGFCLPSPDSWDFNPFWSWLCNTFIIALITFLLYLINKSYNFVRTTETTIYALFPIMAASCAWFTIELNTSVLLCLANVVCLGVMFSTYDTRNATQQMFIVGLVLGLGAMFQYAFLPMAMVYILWALFMKVLRIKETLAFLAGMVCPFWIVTGIGWIRLSEIHFPSITPLFSFSKDHYDFLLLLIAIAVAAGIGFLLVLINTVKLYAGNSKVNAMNLCVTALGAASVVCIIVDFDNMPAYVISLFMACAVQVGNICALWSPRLPWLVTLLPSIAYIAIFVCTLVL